MATICTDISINASNGQYLQQMDVKNVILYVASNGKYLHQMDMKNVILYDDLIEGCVQAQVPLYLDSPILCTSMILLCKFISHLWELYGLFCMSVIWLLLILTLDHAGSSLR
ncbi:unnamed protein product [Vicia faba]|uniref:Uncharacterized protein n=1 Tax=Vicia faba TaxID=3906 RepID=A0AAV1AD00_VICFA|nr:unnamed protein product [Vicia faba]